MGYACPVCELPQADGEHLAHHLAITAAVRGGAHEAWLEAHAPDWLAEPPATLVPIVVEYADETDYPQVFEGS